MFGRILAAFARAQTRRQLNALSNHQLRDIGLTRDQIDDVARRMSEQHRAARVADRTAADRPEPTVILALKSA